LAAELLESTGRRGLLVSERSSVIGTVRKLYKVSEKPASTLGFSTPGVVSKENPLPSKENPLPRLGGALSRSKQVARSRGRGEPRPIRHWC